MKTRLSPLLLALLVATLSALPAPAQSDPADDAQRIAELEEENQRLRQELAELRMELTRLRLALEAQAIEEDMPGGEAEPGRGGATDPEAAEAVEEDVQVFGSTEDIFRSIPQEIRPDRDGWDLPQRLAVEEWLVANIPGSRFEARLEISGVAVGYSTTREDWSVTLRLAPRKIRYLGWDTEQRIYQITLYGDRAFADRARRIEEGARLHVAGTISSAGWGLVVGQVADAPWKPRYYELRLEDPEVRSPHLRR